MSLIQITRFLHIFSAIIFLGGIFARQIIRAQAKKTGDIRDMAALFEVAGRVENLMVIPGNMAVLIFGIILALQLRAPIFGFLQGASRNWLLVSNLLLALGGLSVPLIFLPRGKVFDQAMKDALVLGRMTPELDASIHDRVVQVTHWVEIFVLVVIVILMVFKPF